MQQATSITRPEIITAIVTGYEKRKCPSKHYVFVVTVVWRSDERLEVYRRYNDFFSLHEVLKWKYSDAMKSIPALPKRIVFGRSNTARVAEARLDAINKYCQTLINMDPFIAQSANVLNFFSSHTGDKTLPKINNQRLLSLHPQRVPSGSLFEEHYAMDDYTGGDASELSVKLGDRVVVMAQDPSGWCMCQKDGKNGWLPFSYLRRSSFVREEDVLGFISNTLGNREAEQEMEVTAETYTAIESYESQGPGQVSFKAGDLITVLDKMEDGWWFVSKDQVEGWAPSSYLEPTNEEPINEDSFINQVPEQQSYVARAGYVAENEDELTFPKDAVLTVIQRSLDGWWVATYDGHKGLVPSSHLVPFVQPSDVIQLSQEEWVPKQQYKQPPRKRSIRKPSHRGNTAHVPLVTVEQPTTDPPALVSGHVVARRRGIRPRPKSICANLQADSARGSKSYMCSSTPTSPTLSRATRSPFSQPLPSNSTQLPDLWESRTPTNIAKQHGIEQNCSNQQLAEMIVKFILTSSNPELRAALKRAIEETTSDSI